MGQLFDIGWILDRKVSGKASPSYVGILDILVTAPVSCLDKCGLDPTERTQSLVPGV